MKDIYIYNSSSLELNLNPVSSTSRNLSKTQIHPRNQGDDSSIYLCAQLVVTCSLSTVY